ncbi:hypothetical protein SMICM17S_05698 [Streptomyces microflavus]
MSGGLIAFAEPRRHEYYGRIINGRREHIEVLQFQSPRFCGAVLKLLTKSPTSSLITMVTCSKVMHNRAIRKWPKRRSVQPTITPRA